MDNRFDPYSSSQPIFKTFRANDLNNITAFIEKPVANAANLPDLGGNNVMVISFNPGDSFDAQLAFGFSTDKIAIRRREGSANWTSWKYLTFT